MHNQRLAERYATAVLDVALEQKSEDAVLNDLSFVKSVCEANRDLAAVLASPIIPAFKKEAVFKAVFSDKVNTLTAKFLTLLFQKGREVFLADIAVAYVKLYNNIKHIHTVSLASAVALDENTVNTIKSRLEGFIKDGSIDLKQTVEPQLLGGFQLSVGDLLYDASVANKIKEARKALEQA